MPSSFEAMHEETRPLRLLEEPASPRPGRVRRARSAAARDWLAGAAAWLVERPVRSARIAWCRHVEADELTG